ncbi:MULTISPECIES: acetyl-CoA carboxylase biotin carboxyl carrier protein [Clostridium]|uniref:Biotin carboxyl carrier protein of acetyl-CoA carboxylase n=1 Tax=Clostridium ragsdalei P11 TaxID=1353534 RepID=A0A1A6B296_9CLOT|nr:MULTISPECIES: acetyl-CoA carboxylase biotin carboxyl carrier protein [Clostridium]OBR96403.1 biotin carboxyl carrier protein of acetyl-CoA carboxylase [Clostridium ragsdalei P11]QXE19205.1 acetyl-CoA carboxylase, biotin carboxyl carrier protein [Clostridium sp. 001]
MDFKAIENMIKTMDNSKLGYLEVNWDNVSIIMKKQGEEGNIKQVNIVKENGENIKPVFQKQSDKIEVKEDNIDKVKKSEEKKDDDIEGDNIKDVKSPIVGTFYNSSGPEKPVFVNVGSKVKKGDTLCIIEAMKLMNEIQSEVDGEVVDILVKNEQMVEYGQPLFKIKTEA